MTDDGLDERHGLPALPDQAEAAPESAGAAEHVSAAARDIGELTQVLEALVFVHRGILPPKTVREVLGEEFTAEQIAAGFTALREAYEQRGGALVLLEIAGGYQFGTRTDLAPWIQKLDFYEHHRHLSRPTLETLAIIAYKQPVTRAEIEAIRGVNVERIVRTLIERKLARVLGHKDVPGRPMVLGTTREFLELFGLDSLADLPPLQQFVEPPATEGIDEEPPPPGPAMEPGLYFTAGVDRANPAGDPADEEIDRGAQSEADAGENGQDGGPDQAS